MFEQIFMKYLDDLEETQQVKAELDGKNIPVLLLMNSAGPHGLHRRMQHADIVDWHLTNARFYRRLHVE